MEELHLQASTFVQPLGHAMPCHASALAAAVQGGGCRVRVGQAASTGCDHTRMSAHLRCKPPQAAAAAPGVPHLNACASLPFAARPRRCYWQHQRVCHLPPRRTTGSLAGCRRPGAAGTGKGCPRCECSTSPTTQLVGSSGGHGSWSKPTGQAMCLLASAADEASLLCALALLPACRWHPAVRVEPAALVPRAAHAVSRWPAGHGCRATGKPRCCRKGVRHRCYATQATSDRCRLQGPEQHQPARHAPPVVVSVPVAWLTVQTIDAVQNGT